MRGEQTEHGHEDELPKGAGRAHDGLRQPEASFVPDLFHRVPGDGGSARRALPSCEFESKSRSVG